MQRIHWSGMTHPGRFRPNNEDAFLGLILNEQEVHYLGKEGDAPLQDSQFLFAVSDGMGGANAGDFASRLTLQGLTKRLPLALRKTDTRTPELRQQVLRNIILDIHEEVMATGRWYEECKGMGATLSLCWIHPTEGFIIGHVGDSRIYQIPNGETIIQRSEDHSEVGRLYREGKINERESKNHPERHLLDQSIGGLRREVDPQIAHFSMQPGDHLILCSDGICDGLYDRSIESTLLRPTPNIKDLRPSERLVREALFSSGRDNLTSMVVWFTQEMGEAS
ncbi:MAG: protein phosphatase 2C domain-containing protein [Puniceicoccaceae bacterium]